MRHAPESVLNASVRSIALLPAKYPVGPYQAILHDLLDTPPRPGDLADEGTVRVAPQSFPVTLRDNTSWDRVKQPDDVLTHLEPTPKRVRRFREFLGNVTMAGVDLFPVNQRSRE